MLFRVYTSISKMFKCCVCHGKTSRRTSEEDDEDESSEESSSSSSSSSSDDDKDEEEEERQIEEELAQKFKCQSPPKEEPLLKDQPVNGQHPDSTVQVEVNGDVRGHEIAKKPIDRDAVKEDVVEILNNAVKIVQEIRRGERERLEKIKEEAETAEESRNASPAVVDEEIEKVEEEEAKDEAPTAEKEEEEEDEEKEDEKKPELQKLESDETEEDVVTVIEEQVETAAVAAAEQEIECEIKRDLQEGLEMKSKTDQIEEMIIEELINELNEEADNVQELKEIIETVNNGSQQLSVHSSNEQITSSTASTPLPPAPADESSSSPAPQEEEQEDEQPPPPPTFCEVEIIDEIKKTEIYKIEDGAKVLVCSAELEILEVNVTQGVCPVEVEAVEETIPPDCTVNGGDLLNIPPPVTPPPEEDSDKSNAELDFPTPPPIDFDIVDQPEMEVSSLQQQPNQAPPVPPWDDEEMSIPPAPVHQFDNLLPVFNRQDSKGPSSPGSKSLPSPPSPPSSGSDPGAETEAESKSSSDEQTTTTTTTKIMPCGSKTAYIERTIDDGPDEEGDDSVFESASLAKDPETPKDIPPRPGILYSAERILFESMLRRAHF